MLPAVVLLAGVVTSAADPDTPPTLSPNNPVTHAGKTIDARDMATLTATLRRDGFALGPTVGQARTRDQIITGWNDWPNGGDDAGC